MRTINRREAIASLGLFGGSTLLGGCAHQASGEPGSVETPRQSAGAPAGEPPRPWKYVKLDPYAVAEAAYKLYPDGGCMYAIVGSVMQALAEQVGEPFSSFPIAMMRYGNGGVGGWGSVCGIVNGCAALIGLFQDEKAKERREELVGEICTWYERTPLPIYQPSEPGWAETVAPSVSNSVLCHAAIAKWCEATGCEVKCAERRERCRRASVDGTIRIVHLLNQIVADPSHACTGPSPEVKACLDCHGSRELDNAMGKMSCTSCHSFDGQHP